MSEVPALGKRVRAQIEGMVVAVVAASSDSGRAGKIAVFIPVPDSVPDIHFGSPGMWVWLRPEEVEIIDDTEN